MFRARFIVITGLLLLFFSSCNPFAWRTIVYNVPGIEDYKIMPTRKVKATSPHAMAKTFDYNKELLPDTLQNILQKSRSVAFLVLRNDSILYEWYKPGFSDSSTTNPFSVTKSIVSILTGIALKEGKIKSIDEPVCNYYPEFKSCGRDSLTFRHLLTMSSGLNYYDHYLNPFGKLAKLYYGNNVKGLVNHTKQEKKPGTEWRYKNCDPEILTIALQNAIGTTLSDFASEKLWKPVGCEHDALWIIDKPNTGVEKSYCCMHTNAHDLAKLGMLYEHDGNVNGVQVVDTAYVKQSLTAVNIANAEEKGTIQKEYGLLWWLKNTDGISDFAMEGMSGQYVSVIPEQHLIFVRLGERDWLSRKDRFKGSHLYKRILHSVLGKWGNAPIAKERSSKEN
jgi:CubicO group peptidase (beta-lactamase class C family)